MIDFSFYLMSFWLICLMLIVSIVGPKFTLPLFFYLFICAIERFLTYYCFSVVILCLKQINTDRTENEWFCLIDLA